MKKKVFMLVANSASNDPRVMRACYSLINNGYEVAVGGLAQDSYASGKFKYERFEIYLWSPLLIYKNLSSIAKRQTNKVIPQEPQNAAKTNTNQGVNGKYLSILRTLNAGGLFIGASLSLLKAKATIQQWKPDIIHAHDLNSLWPATIIARSCNAKLLYDSHEFYSEMGSFSFFYKACLQKLEKHLLNKVDTVITVSEGISNLFKERYGIKRPQVILNIPDTPIVKPKIRDDGEIRLLYHGGFTRGRGIEVLVNAFAYLPLDMNIKLILRGSGALKPLLESLATQPGIENRIIFEEPVPMQEVVSAAAQADLGIIPYTGINLNNKLALPNKLFEYMAAGLGVWCNRDLVEVGNILEHHNCGSTYKVETAQKVANQLTDFLRTTDLSKIRSNAHHAIIKRYNWSNESQRLNEIYQQL